MRMQMWSEHLTTGTCVVPVWYLRGCQLWSLWAFAVTLSISKSAASSQHQQKTTFHESLPKQTRFEMLKTVNFFRSSAAELCSWCGQIITCVAYFLNILCVKCCRNQSTTDTTVKWREGCFLTRTVCVCVNELFHIVTVCVWMNCMPGLCSQCVFSECSVTDWFHPETVRRLAAFCGSCQKTLKQ